MKMGLLRKSLVYLIVGLFLAVSIAPVSSLSINQMSPKLDDSIKDDVSSYDLTFPYPVDDIRTNKELSEREDFERDIYEKYPWHYDGYLRNHSAYPFDEPFFDYPDYEEFSDVYLQRFNDKYVKNYTLKDRKPTPKPNFANGKTWYVDDDGGADFTRIQDAINAASDGDTVYVYSGTYYENVVIDKSIILEGEDKDSTIIDGDRHGDVILISVDHVSLCGCKILGSGFSGSDSLHAGIKILSNHVIISDCNISSNSGDGICMISSYDNIIKNNHVNLNGDHGICLYYSNNNTIQGNTFNSNKKNHNVEYDYDPSGGILLCGSIYNNLIGNTFINNSLYIALSHENIIFNNYHNTIRNNIVNGRPLVYLEGESYKTINYKTGQIILISCNNIIIKKQELFYTDVAIQLCNTDFCHISDSIISNNNYGIEFSLFGNNNSIVENILSENQIGIILMESDDWPPTRSDNKIHSNNIISNKVDGIRIILSSYNKIYNNIISNNGGDGILLVSYNSIFSNNIISNNDGYGISLGSIETVISGNMILDNCKGMYIEASINNTISENTFVNDGLYLSPNYYQFIYNNAVDGNLVNNKPLVYIEEESNVVINNGAGQVLIIECNNITVKNNNILNTINGIQLVNTNNCIIENNTLSSNKLNGILFQNSNNNIVLNNLITNNNNGMDFSNSSFTIITDNIIENNHNGICLGSSKSKNNKITNNTIKHNHIGIDSELYMGDTNDIISKNIISNNHFGIALSFFKTVNISENIITNNLIHGIFLFIGGEANLTMNHIHNNSDSGIFIQSGGDHYLFKNVCSSNTIAGIFLFGSSDNIISNCTISSNFQYGIRIEDSSGNLISNSTIKDQVAASSSGISILKSDKTIVKDCYISDNGNAGVELISSIGSNLSSCLLTSNSWGIDLTSSEGNRIEGCTIANNIYGGILEGDNNTICRNNFINNYNHYLHGEWFDTNIFFRNYWSGHFTPLPYRIFNLKFDWFPKAVPYDYSTYNETSIDDSNGDAFDFCRGIDWNGEFYEQNNRFPLIEKFSDRLSSLLSKAYDVLNQDSHPLLDQWRDER